MGTGCEARLYPRQAPGNAVHAHARNIVYAAVAALLNDNEGDSFVF